MKLHEYIDEFRELISIVADNKNLPESAIERDYYIVMLLKNLADSEYADKCVFKGGTSLSKCYPGSIERFSEDIDLTFLGMDEDDKFCDKMIKKIESIMTLGANTMKIPDERFKRSKSMLVWYGSEENKVKLEIGSSVRPDPYCKKKLKSYIHEYLEEIEAYEDINRFELKDIEINVLNIERTFVDKIMSVKRHSICGRLEEKVRHIYDVTRMYKLPEIEAFVMNKEELKRLVRITKETDYFYVNRRHTSKNFNPCEPYDFDKWKYLFNLQIRTKYENLHRTLLYTNEVQDFDDAIKVFEEIDKLFKSIGE